MSWKDEIKNELTLARRVPRLTIVTAIVLFAAVHWFEHYVVFKEELSGKNELVETLKQQLEEARKQPPPSSNKSDTPSAPSPEKPTGDSTGQATTNGDDSFPSKAGTYYVVFRTRAQSCSIEP